MRVFMRSKNHGKEVNKVLMKYIFAVLALPFPAEDVL